eukprot:gnl/MRDRNA2_/MRDRNA2_230690_c0_seq1.p1 gnl/MRDRNA2_/MRDRNA2_230690_c0~~gnl/MRDRNA2_/MRDRNA2_230690_c0_seq1.p1  ORF type:complete len:208 (-),score=62.85 gnl/MRDRNA2_/MRDRNA2_230690_c0_seq1:64-687(-)
MPTSHAAQKRAAAAAARAEAAEKEREKTKKLEEQAPLTVVATAEATPTEVKPSPEEKPIVLSQEICPAGKHQGKTFKEVVEDTAFCKWIMKEPRSGWMGMLKVYLETEHGFEMPMEPPEEEVDPEESAQAAAQAAARAKLMAKGKGKVSIKKKPAPAPEQKAGYASCRVPFIPTATWQEVLPIHICPKGLQFQMDMKTGKNYARFAP